MKSITFSKSGRVVFCAVENKVVAFDLMLGEALGEVGEHEQLVS
jgi:hypothetical protein